MRFRMMALLLLPVVGACSSTVHYEASGYYAASGADVDPARGYSSASVCNDNAGNACAKIALRWETERYCGIYRKAENHTSDTALRVGNSPTTIEHWVEEGQVTVLRGDDEDFESIPGHEPGEVGADLICGRFNPQVSLVDVREGDDLILHIFCRPRNRSIALMPSNIAGYPLAVRVTGAESTWFGCGK